MNASSEPSQKKRKYDKCSNYANNMDFTEDPSGTCDNFTIDEKYSNYATPEEIEKLKEFKVLDEVKSNDEESIDEGSQSSEGETEVLPTDEIEKMLDEDLPEGFKGSPKPKEKPYITRTKIVMEEKGVNNFEILPLDWTTVRHCSGISLYMHRASRVCTLSKPYFLGDDNTRRHDIPISAIPCLAYKRALEEEGKQKEINKIIQDNIKKNVYNQQAANRSSYENDEIKHVVTENNDITKKKNVVLHNAIKNEIEQNENSEEKDEMELDVNKGTVFNNNIIKESDSINNVMFDDVQTNDSTIKLGSVVDCESEYNSNFMNCDESINDTTQTGYDNKMNLLNDTHLNDISLCPYKLSNFDQGLTKSTRDDAIDDSETAINVATEGIISIAEKDQIVKIDDIPLNQQPVILPGGVMMPPPRVESVSTSWKTQHLTPEQVHEYCKNLFKFRSVNIMHFQRWADRRKYTKARKRLKCPTLPEGTKLVTIPATNTGPEIGGRPAKRDWVMNMNGRSYLSVFHEYAHRALQKQPVYEFKQLENASMPYQATVFIDGMQYGVGLGSSKRQAKSAAARASIHILIPEMKEHLEPDNNADPDFSFFDYVGIEDPRIPELCTTACEPSPHAILRTCLLRNFGAADWHIHTEMKKLEYQKIELTMKVGKHKSTVVCKNKKTAKQRAAQSILQALHPHVRSWGSLLRLYGSRSVKSCKEKKLEEQQITLLQDKARHNEPNYAVLEKLRNEMVKLRERDAAVVPIGTLLLPHALPSNSASNLNSVDF